MQLIRGEKVGDMAQILSNKPVAMIKKEKKDDMEIDVLAKEMAEKNRQKMITQAAQIRQQNQVSQQALQRAGGQQMITYYFQRDKMNESADSLLPKKTEEKRTGALDEETMKGRFGWTTIHVVHIPYVFRLEEKYCAVRMVENRLLNKYLHNLPNEITTCIHVRSYFITEYESKLLNEINAKHCEFQFGREAFTTKDLVVRVSDAKCFYKFLDTCYKKLVQKSSEQSEFCGFVRINGESVVPYTVKSGAKFVPLFYFEGETDTLKQKAEKIEGWELAYLKFCCKVQGIRNELFASDTCSVVSLEDVKQYFPKDTHFEDWWPQKTAEPLRMVSQGTQPGGNWTQRPSMPPSSISNSANSNNNQHHHNSHSSKPTPPVLPKPAGTNATNKAVPAPSSVPGPLSGISALNNINNLSGLNNFYSQWAAAASLMNGQVQAQAQAQVLASAYAYPGLLSNLNPKHMRRISSSIANNSAALMQSISAASQAALRPPPLVRSTVSTGSASQTYTTSSRVSNSNIEGLRQLRYRQEHNSANSLDSMYANVQHGATNNSQILSSVGGKSLNSVKVPPPLIPVSNGVRGGVENVSSHKNVTRIDKHKLTDVAPFRPDHGRSQVAYKVRKIIVDGKAVLCINYTAYSYNGQNMVAVQDIIREFFPVASLSECTEVLINVLSVQVFKANWHQVYCLMEAWGTDVTPDIVPLVKASDLVTYLNQIKYIFQRHQAIGHQEKRIRT